MAKRIYLGRESSKYATIAGGAIITITSLFFVLMIMGFEITGSDDHCLGTLEDPCVSYGKICNLGPDNYDIYNPDEVKIDFSPTIKDSWIFFKDGRVRKEFLYEKGINHSTRGWRYENFTNATKPRKDRIYVHRFARYNCQDYMLVGLKENPKDIVKWGMGVGKEYYDPFWYGINDTTNILLTGQPDLQLELGSIVNLTVNLTGYIGELCVDIDHPAYGPNYACGTENVNFLFNISWFRHTEFNDTNISKNVSWTNGGNQTVYIRRHQYDEWDSATINITGFSSGGTTPIGLKIYINDTLSNDLGTISAGEDSVILNNFNDSNLIKNFSYTDVSQTKVDYFRIFKTAVIGNAQLNLTGFPFVINYSDTVYDEIDDSIVNTELWSNESCLLTENTNIILVRALGFRNNCNAVTKSLPPIGSINDVTIKVNFVIPNAEANDVCRFSMHIFGKKVKELTGGIEIDNTIWFITRNETTGTNVFDIFNDGVFDSKVTAVNNELRVNTQGCINAGIDHITQADIFYVYHSTNLSIQNPSLEIGNVDGIPEWSFEGIFDQSNNRTENFSSEITTFLGACIADSEGYCDVPMTLSSDNIGIIKITDIVIDHVLTQNPITLNLNLIKSFFGNSTNFADLPLKFETTANGTLQIDDLRFDYAGGNKTTNIIAQIFNTTEINTFNNSFVSEKVFFTEGSASSFTRYISIPNITKQISFATLQINGSKNIPEALTEQDFLVDSINDGQSLKQGMQVTINQDLTLLAVGLSTNGSKPTTHMYIQDESFVDINVTSITRFTSFWPDGQINLSGGEIYAILQDKDGAAATRNADVAATYNVTGVNLNFTAGVTDDTSINYNAYINIKNITTRVLGTGTIITLSVSEQGIWTETISGSFENTTADFSSILTDHLNDTFLVGSNYLIPINFSSTNGGDINYSSLNVTYTTQQNATINILNFFSNWKFNFPNFIEFLEFIPNSQTSLNVTPFGQSDSKPIFNFTTLNYGGQYMNLSVYLNETFSCVNLTISTDSAKHNGTVLSNSTNVNKWINLHTDKEYLNNSQAWMWADYSCSNSAWNWWFPDLYFRGCGNSTICTEELT